MLHTFAAGLLIIATRGAKVCAVNYLSVNWRQFSAAVFLSRVQWLTQIISRLHLKWNCTFSPLFAVSHQKNDAFAGPSVPGSRRARRCGGNIWLGVCGHHMGALCDVTKGCFPSTLHLVPYSQDVWFSEHQAKLLTWRYFCLQLFLSFSLACSSESKKINCINVFFFPSLLTKKKYPTLSLDLLVKFKSFRALAAC